MTGAEVFAGSSVVFARRLFISDCKASAIFENAEFNGGDFDVILTTFLE